MQQKITLEDAYKCTFRFLQIHHGDTGSAYLNAIIAGMQILEDGKSADAAESAIWEEAVADVMAGKVEVGLQLQKPEGT